MSHFNLRLGSNLLSAVGIAARHAQNRKAHRVLLEKVQVITTIVVEHLSGSSNDNIRFVARPGVTRRRSFSYVVSWGDVVLEPV